MPADYVAAGASLPVRAVYFSAFFRLILAWYLRRAIARAIFRDRPFLLGWVIPSPSHTSCLRCIP
jgi:hypothetical protein